MITRIGIAAGEVWHFLDSHGQAKLEDVLSNIDKPRDILLMSIGWLAREGHVVLNNDGESYLLILRKAEVG
ncbi:MAG: winged helix-turn-helix domain-containing protein [Candidatus Omnitrophica bacterium]|nr:winged helix-turn-helix domain-containing protein [Candidatus Omnitrophota bacterium]